MSINTKKDIIKSIDSNCKFVCGSNPTMLSKCKKNNTVCELNTCKDITEPLYNELSQHKVKIDECKQKYKKSIKEELDCIVNINTNPDIYNLQTQLQYCKATKCKNLMKFNKTLITKASLEHEKHVNKTLSKKEKNNKKTKQLRDRYGCVNKYCKNEYVQSIKSDMLNFIPIFNSILLNKCDQKYIKYKDNEKCKTKDTKKRHKQDKINAQQTMHNYIKCRYTHCKQYIDTDKSIDAK